MPATSLCTRDKFALIAVPALLVLVAVMQLGRAAVLDQSSYAGFGFGMFATYENELSRWSEVTATTAAGGQVPLHAPADIDLRAQEVPTRANVEALAAWALQSDPSFVAARATIWSVTVGERPMQLQRLQMVEEEVSRR